METLCFDEVEEVDGGEPEKEDEWVPTQEDYEHEKEDMALEREGMEGRKLNKILTLKELNKKKKKQENYN